MKKQTWRKALCATVLAGAMAVGMGLPASAAPVQAQLPASVTADLTRVWSENGVAEEAQTALLAKLTGGEQLDAMLGGEPLKVDVIQGAKTTKTVDRFADGSINVTTLPSSVPKEGTVSTQAVGGCTQQGLRFNNCLVSGWFTGVQLSFRATYVTGKNTGRILSYNTPAVQCSPGLNCTSPTFNLIRQRQTGSNDRAVLGMYINYTFVGVGGTGTTYLYLYVKDTTASTN